MSGKWHYLEYDPRDPKDSKWNRFTFCGRSTVFAKRYTETKADVTCLICLRMIVVQEKGEPK